MTSESVLWVDADAGELAVPDLAAWWYGKGLVPEVHVYEGPDLPADPGPCVVVTWTPGPGFSMEQMLDTVAFQVRAIGPQENAEEARVLATMLDRAFTWHMWPGIIGERYVVEVRRAGGKPTLDRLDSAGRTHYVCTYLADVEADSGE